MVMKTYWTSLFSLKWSRCRKPCSTSSERERKEGRKRERKEGRERERKGGRERGVLFAYSEHLLHMTVLVVCDDKPT